MSFSYLYSFKLMNLLFLLSFVQFVYVIPVPSSSSKSPLCRDEESSALLAFNRSFSLSEYASDDPSAYPKTASWKHEEGNSSDCCLWDGVECDDNTGRVISLDLSSSFLYGSINSSSSLFQLTHLQKLNLADNDFNYSQIPFGIRYLSRLTYLNLSMSVFYGQIPLEVSELSMLASLDLSWNAYNGRSLKLEKPSLNKLLQNLTSLKVLHLTEVNISSVVPEILANLSSLTSLFLRGCELHGEFPPAIFQLPNLHSLSVRNNPCLTGHLPEFNESSRLMFLGVAGTNFSGKLPYSIGNLNSLNHLDISTSNFSGPIPSSLANLTQLEYLRLSYNDFSNGSLDWLGKQTKLVVLDLGGTNLNGEFPPAIFQLPNLHSLSVRNNPFLTGHLPEFNESSPLMFLGVSNTNFSGKLPYSIGNLNSLNFLDISYSNFSGPIPSSLANLTQLEYLGLSYNDFSNGSLDWLGKQTKLLHLGLSGTQLNGYIPYSLRNMTRLAFLSFTRNSLIGQIPPWFGNLTQLTVLDLSHNQLHGPIPQTIYKLVNIVAFDVGLNNLNGTVELDKILNLKNLTHIDLSFNHQLSLLTNTTGVNATLPRFEFVGLARCNLSEFPDFLRHQYHLKWLELSQNKIHGQVPKWMFTIGQDTLTYLFLNDNSLTGFFGQDSVVLPWTLLSMLDLSINKLEGTPPTPQPSIAYYSVAKNSLTGELFPSICNLSHLLVLDLSFNNLSGTIPQCLGNFSRFLMILSLQGNNFHGTIPPTYLEGSRLREIDLSHNQLQGSVPRSLVRCTMLEVIDLANNQLTDIFPSWMGILPDLRVLILQSNRFHGMIGNPQTKFDFPKLHIIDLSYNNFSGKLPSEYIENWSAMKSDSTAPDLRYIGVDISHSTTDSSISLIGYSNSITITSKGNQQTYAKIPEIFTTIDLSSNKFEGGIPTSIGTLEGLQQLNLSNNILTGRIPSFLGNLRKLESLDLSQNNFSGEIPQQLAELNFLQVLDVSYNNLTGPIPEGGQLNTFQNNSFEGNLGLCGCTLSKKCGNSEAPVPPQTSTSDEDEDFKFPSGYDWIFIVAGYGSGLVVGLIFGHIWTTRKHEWFIETFGRRPQMRQRGRQRRRRN